MSRTFNIEATMTLKEMTVGAVIDALMKEPLEVKIAETGFWRVLGVSDEANSLTLFARAMRLRMTVLQQKIALQNPPLLRLAQQLDTVIGNFREIESMGVSDEPISIAEFVEMSVQELIESLRDISARASHFGMAIFWDEILKTKAHESPDTEYLAVELFRDLLTKRETHQV